MTMLAAFLLSFYTAESVARWWYIRQKGVGALRAASSELELLISQLVTTEEKVLSAVRRYTQVSLLLIFLWRRNSKQHDVIWQSTVGKKLLLEEEYEALTARGTQNHLHE